MKKTIGIITSRREMAEFYAKIVRDLMNDFAEVVISAAEDESLRQLSECDLYLNSITSYDMMLDSWVREFLPAESRIVQMDMSFSKAAIDLLRTYPAGTKALLVNQNKHMTMECIAQLYHLGISNIEFYPCYPGLKDIPETPVLFTVGEPDLVPEGRWRVIDIGSRWISANTLSEAALKLDNPFFLESDRFRRYRARLANVDYSLIKVSSDSLTSEAKMEMILNSLDEGIVCVDEYGIVRLINKQARQQLGTSRSQVLNRRVEEVLPEIPFQKLKEQEAGTYGPVLLNIRGEELGVVLTPLMIQDQYLGAFATLQGFHASERAQNELRLQRTSKSHKAKYRFRDIVGSSPEISRAKELARRMAANNAAVLIHGESGTGKAMFAQAIHNASPRAGEPFVTVNCAAFSDELLETVLFGYEEGYRGSTSGRTGLVELAHRGTLFLDGIEYMSPRLQGSLLRILQDGEITRLGSDEPISIDTRVISTSGEDMLQLVRDGRFRRDLFYRLNVIQLHIPTLWEHRSDISALISHFMALFDADFELTDQARLALLQHHWEGNVRELKNCIEYLKYTGIHMIDYDDLPDVVRVTRARNDQRGELERKSGLKIQEYWVLKELGEVYADAAGLGRQALVARCMAHGNAVSEHEVREILKKLDKMELVKISSGRGGTRLTEKGYLRYRQIVHEGE